VANLASWRGSVALKRSLSGSPITTSFTSGAETRDCCTSRPLVSLVSL
jgi:hypothetical protein